MEFVQFYPLGLAEPMTSSVIIYPPIPREARLINEKGEDLFLKYDLQYSLHEAVMGYCDELTLLLSKELQQGPVYMDCTQVPAEKWATWFLNMLARINPSLKKRAFLVMPSVHFFMGGAEIDDQARTALTGLFAAGEVTAGVHGANREGGNSFTECIVFGDIAGASAGECALRSPPVRSAQETPIIIRNPYEWKIRSEEEKDFLNQLQDVAWSHAGPIRNAETLREGLSRLNRMEEKMEGPHGRPISHRLNEINQALMVSRAIMTASLKRKESRGAFYREDYLEGDDRNWLKNILLQLDRETGELVVHHQSVGR